MARASVQIIEANGVNLCAETFGDRTDPGILLIMGSGASMDWWEDEFCERLATGPRFVIRYDHRDTGQSVSYEPGAPRYTSGDLVADTVGLLDAFGLAAAHLVGMSMGGALAQLVALDHPDRVVSLTLISTSPAGPEPDLPPMSEEAKARFAKVSEPDWSDREAVIDYGVELARASASGSRPFDEAGMRELWGRVVDRTGNVESSFKNHDLVEGGERWRERLGGLTVPTLVIHGAEDPLFPLGHGSALAREIPGARLLALERTGHELPRAVWDVVVPAILEHTSAGAPAAAPD
jgi:pimeloyl-ACP methyl ester carboxylesterase